MHDVRTHYDNLKIARNAPPEVIRAAYKALVQKYHPDKHGNSERAAKILLMINEAYAVLSDPEKKARHDAWIRAQAPRPRPLPLPAAAPPAPVRRGGWMWVAALVLLAFGLGMVMALQLPGVAPHLR
ncbi:DnaJ domain-containing protein [Pseudomonas sp. NPDC007930]|uniref:J domain-containing protein n=1 Tax=Pseudomonas sp. NPDC007930 TaxID=3364417 RepID=UPI0036EC279E